MLEDKLCPNSCRPWSVTSHSFPDLVTKLGTIMGRKPHSALRHLGPHPLLPRAALRPGDCDLEV